MKDNIYAPNIVNFLIYYGFFTIYEYNCKLLNLINKIAKKFTPGGKKKVHLPSMETENTLILFSLNPKTLNITGVSSTADKPSPHALRVQ